MLSGIWSFNIKLFAVMSVLGSTSVALSINFGGNRTFGYIGLLMLLIILFLCLYQIGAEPVIRKRLRTSGRKVVGTITSIRKEMPGQGPVIVRYTYIVDGMNYEGSVWKATFPLKDKEWAKCTVIYDPHKPADSMPIDLWSSDEVHLQEYFRK
jgi:hypothetical protein